MIANQTPIWSLPRIDCRHIWAFCFFFLSCSRLLCAPEDDLRVNLPTGWVFAFHESKDALWIGTEQGLFRWTKGDPKDPRKVDWDQKWVVAFHEMEGELWIGTNEGVFRWTMQDQAQPIPMIELTDEEEEGPAGIRFYQVGNTLWISAIYGVKQTGLYRWTKGKQGPLKPIQNRPPVWAFHEMRNKLWMGTGKGLYRWTKGTEENPMRVGPHDVQVNAIGDLGDRLWISAGNGLFHCSKDEKTELTPVNLNGGKIWALRRMGDTLWIGADKGLFRYTKGRQGLPEQVSGVTEPVIALHRSGNTLWVGAKAQDKGLFRWDDGSPSGLRRLDLDTQWVNKFYETYDWLWIVTELGLLRYTKERNKDPQPFEPIGGQDVHAFRQVDDTLWIGAQRLFRLEGFHRDWDAQIQVDTSQFSSPIYTNATISVTWKIGNYARRTTPKLVRCRLIVSTANGDEVNPGGWEVPPGQFEYSIGRLPEGNYNLVVEATDLFGKVSRSDQNSQAVSFHVARPPTPLDTVWEWLKVGSKWYVIVNLLVFAIMLTAARWSRLSFDILTDPQIRKLGLWFGLALCYVRFVRVWVFERYYRNMRADFAVPEHDYLDRPIRRPDGSSIKTYEMLNEFKRLIKSGRRPHIWVSGGPGTGKTEMVHELMRLYFQAPSLRKAWKQFGFIPLIVPVREATGKSLPDLARSALEGYGFSFENDKFFQRLLRGGGFLIVLDGLNEKDLDDMVKDYAARNPSVRMLMTSQDTFALPYYRVPSFDPASAKELLGAFLGDPVPGAGIAGPPWVTQIADSVSDGLWNEVQSGYDVKLIADLARVGQPLPADRLSLYEAIMDFAVSLAPAGYPESIVCEAAWLLWKERSRSFPLNYHGLDNTRLAPLREANVVVQKGKAFEFRHDLMRGYLAARWATRHAASSQVTLDRLEEKEIWNLPPTDQNSVFEFLTELRCNSQDSLEEIAQLAAKDTNRRIRLLVAAQASARKRQWALQPNLGTPVVSLASVVSAASNGNR